MDNILDYMVDYTVDYTVGYTIDNPLVDYTRITTHGGSSTVNRVRVIHPGS